MQEELETAITLPKPKVELNISTGVVFGGENLFSIFCAKISFQFAGGGRGQFVQC